MPMEFLNYRDSYAHLIFIFEEGQEHNFKIAINYMSMYFKRF